MSASRPDLKATPAVAFCFFANHVLDAEAWARERLAPFAGFANTELLFWLLSGQVLIMVIIGGAGTLIGPILGAAFFLVVQQYLSNWTTSWALFFGAIFIAFVLFAPEGIWGLALTRLPALRRGGRL